MQVASYLPWPACLALAAGSAVVLHLLAVHLSTPMGSAETVSAVQSPGVLGAFYARTLYGTFATFLQFLIPAALLFAALASLVRRSQAQALLAQAQSAPAAAISSMTWSQFERLIGESFRRRGYEVTETGGSGSDGGVDLLLAKDRKSFLVQCKHWRTRSVGVSIVRELNGVIAARHAAGGFVVTSGQFTPEATQFARSCGIELIDGDRLRSLLHELEPKPADRGGSPPASKPIATLVAAETNTCPECGSPMARRTRYPACPGVRQIAVLSGNS
jgi:restriction system protein